MTIQRMLLKTLTRLNREGSIRAIVAAFIYLLSWYPKPTKSSVAYPIPFGYMVFTMLTAIKRNNTVFNLKVEIVCCISRIPLIGNMVDVFVRIMNIKKTQEQFFF